MKLKEIDYETAVFSMSSKVYNNEISSRHDKDISILIHATKKQIGKKVVRSEKYGSYRCPCCDAVIHRTQHYCSQCGQKFDWR